MRARSSVRLPQTSHAKPSRLPPPTNRARAPAQLKTWFFLDLFSSLPYDLMIKSLQDMPALRQGKKGLKMLRLLRLAKLMRLMRLSRFVRMMRQRFQGGFDMMHVHIDAGFIDITKLIAVFLLTVHWT